MPAKPRRALLPRTLARRAALLAADKQALDILVLDVRAATDFTDFFVICSGAVDVHVSAIADHIEREMRAMGYRPAHTEGADTRRWILLDYVDIVVHIFQPDARTYYALERLWGDAKVVNIKGLEES